MIGSSKITEKIIRENAFEHKKSANRPSNNWAQKGVSKALAESGTLGRSAYSRKFHWGGTSYTFYSEA